MKCKKSLLAFQIMAKYSNFSTTYANVVSNSSTLDLTNRWIQKKDAEPNLTWAQICKLTMWPEGLPRALQFFAMVAQTPDYMLKSKTRCAVWGGTEQSAPPKLHAQTQKIHHLGLPVTSCLKGKSYHGNKPQKRKCGYYDQTVLSLSWETLWCGDADKSNTLVAASDTTTGSFKWQNGRL